MSTADHHSIPANTSELEAILHQQFGFRQFRPGQRQVIEHLLAGHSSLAIFPTGSGKSLCYQFSALQLPHLTLVVSPLLALMKDQLAFLADKGIAAASIDSSQGPQQSQQVMAAVRSGQLKILMVSVERFKNERFRQFIQSVPLSLLVIDEAHCISEWGHNFRPDYLKLPSYQQQLAIPQVLLLTATATHQVKQDMAERFAIASQHIVQTGFYRANLDLTVLPVNNREKPQQLANCIAEQQGPGIVYVTLQQSAEQVANQLRQHGINAKAYHAGLEDQLRYAIQHDFMAGKLDVVVATIAFGMGVDKSNIRFVIHYDLPKSIENYSQEIGRAGRDNQPANCITLANLDSLHTIENFVYGDTPELNNIQRIVANISEHQQHNRWEMQLNSLATESNIRPLPLKTLLVQLELLGVLSAQYSYFAEFRLRFIVPQQEILEQFDGERRNFLTAVFNHTAMKKIWGVVDFDSLYQAYGGERSRVLAALEYLQEKGLIELQTKGITDVYQVQSERLDNPALATQLHDYFVNKEHKEIQRIAALVAFFQQDSCLTAGLAGYFDDQNAPARCGHCSVCRGEVAHLSQSPPPAAADDQQLINALTALHQHLLDKVANDDMPLILTINGCCRFLAGLSTPLFTRYRVKQLPGFGLCEKQRYRHISEQVQKLHHQLPIQSD